MRGSGSQQTEGIGLFPEARIKNWWFGSPLFVRSPGEGPCRLPHPSQPELLENLERAQGLLFCVFKAVDTKPQLAVPSRNQACTVY